MPARGAAHVPGHTLLRGFRTAVLLSHPHPPNCGVPPKSGQPGIPAPSRQSVKGPTTSSDGRRQTAFCSFSFQEQTPRPEFIDEKKVNGVVRDANGAAASSVHKCFN